MELAAGAGDDEEALVTQRGQRQLGHHPAAGGEAVGDAGSPRSRDRVGGGVLQQGAPVTTWVIHAGTLRHAGHKGRELQTRDAGGERRYPFHAPFTVLHWRGFDSGGAILQ